MLANARKDIDAKVVDGALVVSFLGADQPRVWRAHMAGLQIASFELQEKGKDFSVIMKSGGAEEKIITFGDMESAAFTLQAMTSAMQRGSGGSSGNIFTLIVKIAVVTLAVIFILKILLPPVPGGGGSSMRNPMAGTEMGSAALVPPGEPVPADQIFGGR